MLIATLPAVHRDNLLRDIISHPSVDGVRYNVGSTSAYSPRETLERILAMTERYGKKLWIDLKGRQLRIVHWAVPEYGKIELNHEVEVDCPAKVFFRGNEWSELKVIRGNVIYVDPPPRYAVGAGQAINVHGNNLQIKGYLTEEDRSFISVSAELGINDYMLSFVEQSSDLQDVLEINSNAKMVLKIESPKGMTFINATEFKIPSGGSLMAARDDLMINIGDNKANMLVALDQIISKDSEAIVASRIFSGIENGGEISMGDLSDLCLMEIMGYKHFMLSDEIGNRYFLQAMKSWIDYKSANQIRR